MKRISTILFVTLLLAVLYVSCGKADMGPYVRWVYTIDGQEFEYNRWASKPVLDLYAESELWSTGFSLDSLASYYYEDDVFVLRIESDTVFFVEGKRYYYSEHDTNYTYANAKPNCMISSLPALKGKRCFSGSFQFNVLEWEDTSYYYGYHAEPRVDYYIQFDTRWVDESISDSATVLDTVIFNGRIEAYARLHNYSSTGPPYYYTIIQKQ